MLSPAPDVFLSYKAEDRARLKPLVEALEGEGFAVWWDAQIGGGTNAGKQQQPRGADRTGGNDDLACGAHRDQAAILLILNTDSALLLDNDLCDRFVRDNG